MNPRKSIWLYFGAGMVVGALGAGLLVYFGSVKANQDKISVNLVPGIIRDVMDMMRRNKEVEPLGDFSTEQQAGTGDKKTTNANPGLVAREDEAQSGEGETQQDSLSEDNENTEEIVIKRDEFILAVPIDVINLDFKGGQKNQQKSDSLLAQNSGIKENKDGNGEARFKFEIEYWQSPINYRGYRLGVNKFVLFGMDPDEPVNAYFWKGNYYLKWRENYYLLKENEGFQPFEKVSQPELAALTKK